MSNTMFNQASALRPMWTLLRYLCTYPVRFWFAVSSSIANKIFDLMPPLLVGWIIATVAGHAPHWVNYFVADTWHAAIFIACLAVLIFGAESLFQWMGDYGFMTLAQRAQHDLRVATYKQVQNREMAFFEQHRVGETMAMINDDVNQLERFLNWGLSDVLQLVTLIAFSTYVLFSNSWQLAIIAMGPIPFIIWGSLYYQGRIAPRYKKVRQTVGDLATRLENNLSGITVIKSFTAEEFETQRLSAASTEYCRANYDAITLTTIFVPLIRIAVAVSFAGILLAGSYWVLHGKYHLTLAQLVMFTMMSQRLLWPLTRLGNTLDEFERARASARRIFNLLATSSTIKETAQPQPLQRARGEISFTHAGFHYENKLPILQDLNFTVAAGETVGIAGHTGAGKSTLVKLLLRFYDVTSGAIKIDGHDIRDLSLQDLRRNIALVSQDVYLFHGSVQENISYGLTEVTLEQIIAAAQLAQLHDFISSLPNGYNTIVGERGIKLSGGQRQRLSIARAILKNAPILILDEATSSVDTETERLIQQSLTKLTAGRTALIIAHRLSTIRNADRILVLRHGKVVEHGHHSDLIMRGGNYADLWNVQSGADINIA